MKANDMANGSPFDPETRYAQLGERVDNQATRIADLDMRMRQGFTDVSSQLRTLSDDVRGGSKTQWPIIIGFCSVTITVLGGLGFLALQPIKDNVAALRDDAKVEASNSKQALSTIVASMVTQKEMEWRTARGMEDRSRMEASIKEVRDNQVPRSEIDRLNQFFTQRFEDVQRQLDDIKQAQGAVYGQRDIILDLRENQKQLEREISRLLVGRGPTP